jgi:hypothetical protein
MNYDFMSKKVKLQLVGLDGNAFSILGAFSGAARRQGWTREEIDAVTKEAMSSDYTHLLATIAKNCKDPAGPGEASEPEEEMGL